jgi:hypothetical protein
MISSTNKCVNVPVFTVSLHADEITTFEIKAYAVFCEKRMNKRCFKKQSTAAKQLVVFTKVC